MYRDAVLASALLHDVIKPLIYSLKEEGFDVSLLRERLDNPSPAVVEFVR